MMKNFALLVAFLIFILGACNGHLEVSLSTPTQSFLRGSPISVNVHLSNVKQQEPIYILKWGTPYETDAGFEIIFENITVPYQGISFYRVSRTPTAEDYIEIKAAETVTIQANIWKNFDFTKVGTYHLRLNYFIYAYSITQTGEKLELAPFDGLSNELTIHITPSNLPLNHFHPGAFHVLAPYDCTATQMTSINTAWSTSKSTVSGALNNFNGGSSNYLKWFGARSTTREARVKTVLGKLNSLGSLKWQCGGPQCTANTYGYVYPTDSQKNVYLCAMFWTSAIERVRTIIHEATHFSDIGATQDYAYGTSACMSLATNSPDKAVYNADNHCYFCY